MWDMNIFAKIGTLFLILSVMMQTLITSVYDSDEKVVFYSVSSFAIGIYFLSHLQKD